MGTLKGGGVKVLKTEEEYRSALADLEELMDADPALGTDEADKLELLTLLVQEYESKKVSFDSPDPIAAIQFRMEQQGLSQSDLVPYIGSRSKVSEVLSRKRPLSVSMIRGLHFGLGIPASALIKKSLPGMQEEEVAWDQFPIEEMLSRGWLKAKDLASGNTEDLVRSFYSTVGQPLMSPIFLKQDHIRSSRKLNRYALAAWSTWILLRAKSSSSSRKYQPGSITMDFLRSIARLSIQPNGPVLAVERLHDHGIIVIIERHLSQMPIDGVATMSPSGQPVIGLTLRHDRIDNFWFVLFHELAHIWRHVHNARQFFYDDLDVETDDRNELEADDIAGDALVPRREWDRSPAKVLPSAEAAKLLASKLEIHPAIVAGKMRHVRKNYKILTSMIGLGEIRHLFTE
jgi:HTH-type transcriptional regulator / antitoxin HigA